MQPTLLQQVQDLFAKLNAIAEGQPMNAADAHETLIVAKELSDHLFAFGANGNYSFPGILHKAERAFIYGPPKAAESQ